MGESSGARAPVFAYKNYLLTVLLVILISNTMDRVALGLLMQDIKMDLHLSDTQLGFLTGIAFALFYSVMGIPIARWADRGNRITIITLTTALWSAAVALCGMAGSFLQLLLIRIGVAVGEAGCVPPAHSLLADHFDRTERPRAVARYMLGYPLSYLLGYFLAGWLNQRYGWRTTFILLGVPGFVLAGLAWLTLKEPRRASAMTQGKRIGSAGSPSWQRDTGAPSQVQPSLRQVCETLWANATFRHLLLCYSIAAFFGYGVWQWKPAFFIRTFHLDTLEVGAWFALINGGCGLVGMYCGGELAARVAARNERLQLRAMSVAYCSFAVMSAGMYLASDYRLAFGLMALSTVGLYTVYGPLFATLQTLVSSRMRAVSLAAIYLFSNLIGMGLGPLAAGALSDALRPIFGEESLRYALVALCPGYLWAALHLWQGSRTVTRDLETAQRERNDLALQDARVVHTGSGA